MGCGRMKTELLIQMDGVKGRSTVEQQVFVMAASNLPWDLDVAVLRRLEKRVLVPLPEKEARELMLRKHISDRVDNTVDFAQVQIVVNMHIAHQFLLLFACLCMPLRGILLLRCICSIRNLFSNRWLSKLLATAVPTSNWFVASLR